MEIFNNGTTKNFYRNGSVAEFNQTGFVRFIVQPSSFFILKLRLAPEEDGTVTEIFSNGTTRIIAPAVTFFTDPQERALGFTVMDKYQNGSSMVYYRNGTVALFNETHLIRYIVPPTSFYVTYETLTYDDGSVEYTYSNGTVIFYSRPLTREDDLTYKQLSFSMFRKENGMMTVWYRNGSQALFNSTGFVRYIVAPDVIYSPIEDGGYSFYYVKTNFTVIYNKPFEEETTERARAVSFDYSEIFRNGTRRTVYRNGTIAIFDNRNRLTSYERAPKSIYEVIVREVLSDGSE